MPETFTLFPLLPKEIRILIWELAITPRVLSLHCKTYDTYGSGGAIEPFLLKLFVSSPKRYTFPFTKTDAVDEIVRFSIAHIPLLPALCVCNESRQSLITGGGYKAWEVDSIDGDSQYFLWNPKLDTIAFAGPHPRLLPQLYAEIFYIQFPDEAKEVERLAVPSSHWKDSWGPRIDRAEHWIRFAALKEMVVVVDVEFERACVRRVMEDDVYTGGVDPFSVPGDIMMALEKGKAMRPDVEWRVPDVRVVRDKNGILEGADLYLTLRCCPCPDLNEPGP
jgi:2EXR family